MTRRLTFVAVLLAALLAMGSVSVQANEVFEVIRIVPIGSDLDRSFVGTNATVVVLKAAGKTLEVPNGCGIVGGSYPSYHAVVFFHAINAAPTTSKAIPFEFGSLTTLAPGTRFETGANDNRYCSLDGNGAVVSGASPAAISHVWQWGFAKVIGPTNSTPLLFSTTANVSDDSLGVITGQQDEDGFAEVVVTNKGEKPTFATLLTDEWLEPADRIVDILQLDYDPETGIALHGGFLEY